MWPMRHETMTRDECRKCLRCLELEAYASMVSVLRAQGPFSDEKRKLLQELAKVLHITNERHRAEVRRAVNDEKLATIAEQLSGPNTASDWSVEGRRAIPLLPRSKGRSAFQTLANSLSLATAAANKRNVKNEAESVNSVDYGDNVKAETMESRRKEEKLVDENVLSEVTESDRNITDVVSEKRKLSSPLSSPSLPSKVLLLSSSAESKECSENTVQLSRMPANCSHQQNVGIIRMDNCTVESSEATMDESKLRTIQDSPPQDCCLISPKENSSSSSSSSSSSAACSAKQRIVPLIQATAKPTLGNSQQRLMVSTVSNGPGPPQKQITTLTCKKLPAAALNNQTTAKMGVTLSSNKTVNISHHPDAKLAAKTNVIVIQKGQSKGVTLSHAGKEVLGKMIMGGKSLCVTSQHNASISVLPRHITLNNGEQTVAMLSTGSPHTEPIKSTNTITFNLRQDLLEKNKALSQLLESKAVKTKDEK